MKDFAPGSLAWSYDHLKPVKGEIRDREFGCGDRVVAVGRVCDRQAERVDAAVSCVPVISMNQSRKQDKEDDAFLAPIPVVGFAR
jgi:hypothetical protein